MEHIDGLRELDGINGAVGITAIVFHNFQNARSLALPGFSGRMLPPNCPTLRATPMASFTGLGNCRRSSREDATQNSGFSPAARTRRVIRLSQNWDSLARTGFRAGIEWQACHLFIYTIKINTTIYKSFRRVCEAGYADKAPQREAAVNRV
jgi:hypothetical protein